MSMAPSTLSAGHQPPRDVDVLASLTTPMPLGSYFNEQCLLQVCTQASTQAAASAQWENSNPNDPNNPKPGLNGWGGSKPGLTSGFAPSGRSEPMGYTLVAATACEFAVLQPKDLEPLLACYPSVAGRLVARLNRVRWLCRGTGHLRTRLQTTDLDEGYEPSPELPDSILARNLFPTHTTGVRANTDTGRAAPEPLGLSVMSEEEEELLVEKAQEGQDEGEEEELAPLKRVLPWQVQQVHIPLSSFCCFQGWLNF